MTDKTLPSFAGLNKRFRDLGNGAHAEEHFAYSLNGAIDSTGKWFPLESCKIEEYENTDGTLAYIEATMGTDKWRQTYTYSAVNPKRTTGQWTKVVAP